MITLAVPQRVCDVVAGAKASYVDKDDTAVGASATFGKDGAYEASWTAGQHKGEVSGEWYAEDGKRCLKDEKPNGGGTNLECHAIYKTGDVYLSVNEDGTVHGVPYIVTARVSPLQESGYRNRGSRRAVW